MKVFLIILAVLLFINILPIGAHVIYNENGVVLRAVLGLIQIPLLPKRVKRRVKAPGEPPGEEKPENPRKAAKKKQQEEKKASKKEAAQKKKLQRKVKPKEKKPLGVLIEQFLPFVKLGLSAIADMRWLPTIWNLKLHVVYGGGDPGAIAKNYGMAWGIIGAAMAILTRNLKIHKYNVEPELDYSCTATRISADATVTLTLGGIMCWLIHYGVGALRLFINMKKNEKAVQKHESSST